MIGISIRFLLLVSCISNLTLVTYLLGNIKKELDRLSWLIISIAILGIMMAAFDQTTSLAAVAMVFVAGLLNFVEPDE